MWRVRAHASASSPPALLSLQSEHGARRFGAGLLLNPACDRRGAVMATFDQLEHLAALCAEEIRECNPGNAEYACPTDASDALLARCLHVTLACLQPKTLQDAWSLQPFALIASAEDILRAAMILQHMGKARFNPPIEAVTFGKGRGFEIDQWVEIEWVEAVDIDALWRAWGDATVVRSEWGKRADIGDAQTAIKRIDQQIAELTHNRGLWEMRLAKLTTQSS